MSKRFGRNQRRKLQKQVADITHAHTLDRRLLAHQRGAIERMEHSLRNVHSMLGRHFAGLEPQTAPSPEKRIPREITILDAGGTSLAEMLDIQLSSIRTRSLTCTQVRAEIDSLRGQTHVRVTTALGEVAYAFSPTAFRGMPRREVIRQLAEAMAHHLVSSPEVQKYL